MFISKRNTTKSNIISIPYTQYRSFQQYCNNVAARDNFILNNISVISIMCVLYNSHIVECEIITLMLLLVDVYRIIFIVNVCCACLPSCTRLTSIFEIRIKKLRIATQYRICIFLRDDRFCVTNATKRIRADQPVNSRGRFAEMK